MKTTLAVHKAVERKWVLIDANNQVLGRMATKIAMILRGKNKVGFTPFIDTGDFVIVINAKQVKVTGKKLAQKMYRTYSGYPGGLKSEPLANLLQRAPERVIERAVKGMMPDGPLGRQMLGKLKVYPGAEHPHGAQQPKVLVLA